MWGRRFKMKLIERPDEQDRFQVSLFISVFILPMVCFNSLLSYVSPRKNNEYCVKLWHGFFLIFISPTISTYRWLLEPLQLLTWHWLIFLALQRWLLVSNKLDIYFLSSVLWQQERNANKCFATCRGSTI
jgi:hypothetical protein